MQALLVLLRAEGATVTREALIEACWDGRIVSDDAVNRVIALLRGLSRQFDPPPFELHTIPKIGFRLDVAKPQPAQGAADAATEPTPAAQAPPASPAHKRPLRWIMAAAVVLTTVVGSVAWLASRAPWAGPGGRVEVAPLRSLRPGDPDLARVSQATRQALVHVLRNAAIPVVESPSPPTGAAPDADFHLRGDVDRDGDNMVINVQVLDRRARNVLWSGRLDRPLASQAWFPDQAANRIVDTLYCGLHSRAASNRRMTDAVLSLMLQACELRRMGPDESRKFLAAAERVRSAAPTLSAAQSIYALAAASQSVMSPPGPEATALQAEARAAARRALQLDPRNGEAYFAIGLSYGIDGSWFEREANFRRAEALTQGFSVVRDLHVGLLREVGRLQEARELNRRTVADDPFSPDQLSTLYLLTAAADGPEAAGALLQRLRMVASPEEAEDVRLTSAFWWSDPKAAATLLSNTHDGFATGGRPCFAAYLASLDRPAPRRGLPESCRSTQPDWRIRMLAREGDLDGAYAEIGRAPRGAPMLIALFHPEMRAFRADPRFMPLAARYGLVDYWSRSGHWPDFCADPQLPYDCRAVAKTLAQGAAPVPAR